MVIYGNTITTVVLANTSTTSYDYLFFFFYGENIYIKSLSNFEVYNAVLLIIITMLCARSPELIYLLVAFYIFLC